MALSEDEKFLEYHRICQRMHGAESALDIKKILVGELKLEKKALSAAKEQQLEEIRAKYVTAAEARHAATHAVKLKLWDIYLELREAGRPLTSKLLLFAYEERWIRFSYTHKTKKNPIGEERDISLKTLEKWYSEFNKHYTRLPAS